MGHSGQRLCLILGVKSRYKKMHKLILLLFLALSAFCSPRLPPPPSIRHLSFNDCDKIAQYVNSQYSKFGKSTSFHWEIIPIDLFPFFALDKPIKIPKQKEYCNNGSFLIHQDSTGELYVIIATKFWFNSEYNSEPRSITYRLFYVIIKTAVYEYKNPISIVFIRSKPGEYLPR